MVSIGFQQVDLLIGKMSCSVCTDNIRQLTVLIICTGVLTVDIHILHFTLHIKDNCDAMISFTRLIIKPVFDEHSS